MKKLIYIFAAISLSAGFSSCNDILDVNSTTQLSDQAIWSKPETADGYVIAAYNTITDHPNVFAFGLNSSAATYYDAYTDLIKSTSWDAYNYLHNKTMMLPTQFSKSNAGPFGSWGSYGRIKRTNLLLNDIDRYGAKFGEEWCEIRRAEARFCNAISYFFIARVYGGVVLRTHNSGAAGLTDDGAYPQDCNRARITEEQTYDYIISEIQWAIERLPLEWEAQYYGRATKGMAYGFLSRIALYAKKWDIAVDAAEKCKELGGYELVDDYASVFDCNNEINNRKEIIYAIYGKKQYKLHYYDAFIRPIGDADVYNTNGGGRMVPTAELADMFEYKDGTKFDWDTWKQKRDDNNVKLTDPYSYREPRFHATILYNGAQWEGREIQTYVGANSSVPDGTDYFVEYQNAGTTDGHTCTGYYLRKFLMEGHTAYKTDQSWNNDIILRYAEVLLNKAEALAELGQIDDALIPLNEVRARVNLPAKTRVDAPDKEAFMEILRNERCCELAGEGLRFWDLRRWRLAAKVIDGQSVHGVKISKRASGTLTYTTVDADGGRKRVYQDRYNYFSIPSDELTNNKLCVDNPGW